MSTSLGSSRPPWFVRFSWIPVIFSSVVLTVRARCGVAPAVVHATYAAALAMAGVSVPAAIVPHPEVVRWAPGPVWPADKPFPLTPLKAWYVMRGWWVAPAAGVTMEQIIEELPGKLEGGGN